MKRLKLSPSLLFLFAPIVLFAAGFLSNAIVMAANEGQMPVLIPGGCSAEVQASMASEVESEGFQIHTCMTPQTHLKILADWIVIRHSGVWSPGDFMEAVFYEGFGYSVLIWLILMLRKEWELCRT